MVTARQRHQTVEKLLIEMALLHLTSPHRHGDPSVSVGRGGELHDRSFEPLQPIKRRLRLLEAVLEHGYPPFQAESYATRVNMLAIQRYI